MSEMQDAVQIIRVTYEGMEMFFRIGNGGLKPKRYGRNLENVA